MFSFLKKINFRVFFVFLSLFLLMPFAGLTDFEARYPEIDGRTPVYEPGEGLPEYVSYMAQLLIVVALIVAVLSLIKGGSLIITARDNPIKVKEGKERVTASLFGLIIVLSSVVFLSNINPQLVELSVWEVAEVDDPFPHGIYLSTESTIPEDIDESMDSIYRIRNSRRDLEGLPVKAIRIANHLDRYGEVMGYHYAILLHEERAFRGRCKLLYHDGKEPKDFHSIPEGVSSITVIPVDMEPLEEGRVTAYLRPDFNENYPFEDLDIKTEIFRPLSIDEVWSIDIDGNYAVGLSEDMGWGEEGTQCGIFLDSRPYPDLKEHHMNKCNPRDVIPYYMAYDSCASYYIVLPLFR